MTQLHKNIHKPRCEEFHVGTIFFLPNYIRHLTVIKGVDTTFRLVKRISALAVFGSEDTRDLSMCSQTFLRIILCCFLM